MKTKILMINSVKVQWVTFKISVNENMAVTA
jgi:hypothetical protein